MVGETVCIFVCVQLVGEAVGIQFFRNLLGRSESGKEESLEEIPHQAE